MSSTICAVSRLSSSPTAASVAAKGKMIRNVSKVSGTSGQARDGRAEGSSPSCATVRTSSLKTTETAVSTIIATSGAGTARVMRGKP
ncbi:hypothetical protein D3C72_2360540 [compost metagenome]